METLFIVLAVVFGVAVIMNQVMFHVTDNRYGYPEVYFANGFQRWLYISSVALTILISIFGWVSTFVFVHEIQIVRPLLWPMFVSGIIIIIVNLGVRSDYDAPLPGCLLSAFNVAFGISGLFAI